MTKHDDTPDLSRRRALTRIGSIALAAYSVPAFTTLSAAHASSSGASAPSAPSEPSAPSAPSAPSSSSGPSRSSSSSSSSSSGNRITVTEEECNALGGTYDAGFKYCTLK